MDENHSRIPIDKDEFMGEKKLLEAALQSVNNEEDEEDATLRTLKKKVILLSRLGRPKEGLIALQHVLSATETVQNAPLFRLAGTLHFALGNLEAATSCLEKCHQLLPSDIETLSYLAICYHEKGEYEAEIKVCDDCLKLERSPFNLTRTALCILDLVESEQSKVDDGTFVQLLSRGAETANERSTAYNQTDCLQRAHNLLQEALQLEPGRDDARRGLAQFYFLTEDWPQAVMAYEDLVLSFPDDARMLSSLGACYVRVNRVEDARNTLNKARRLDDKNKWPEILVNLCALNCQRQNCKEALSTFEHLLQTFPKELYFHAQCGLHLVHVGKEKEILKIYQKFVEEHPNTQASRFFHRAFGKCRFEECEQHNRVRWTMTLVLLVGGFFLIVFGYLKMLPTHSRDTGEL